MEDKELKRTRIRGTKLYIEQNGKYWIRRAGDFKETDQKPYVEDPTVVAKRQANKSKITLCKSCFKEVEPNIPKCPHGDSSNPANSIGVKLAYTIFNMV